MRGIPYERPIAFAQKLRHRYMGREARSGDKRLRKDRWKRATWPNSSFQNGQKKFRRTHRLNKTAANQFGLTLTATCSERTWFLPSSRSFADSCVLKST
jgi:hypothetical protein